MDDDTSEAFDSAHEYFRGLLNRTMSVGRTINRGSNEFYQPKGFLRSGAAGDILSEQDLRERVLGWVVHRHGGPRQDDLDLEKIRGSPGLCAILLNILAFGTLKMIPFFEARFLEEPLCGKSDDDLPFDEHFAKQLFGGDEGTQFFNTQFAFVAVMLGNGLFHREYQASRCLPYLEDVRIGRGAFGKVYKVKIERGHFFYREPRSRNMDPVLLARKDFDPDPASYKAFEDEDRMLREFVNSSNCPSNIMTSICSIVCTLPDTESKLGSIFFPPATCDLTTYIDSEANKPRSHAGRLRHIRQMLGVCQALEWLARNLTYKKDSDQFVAKTYDHCDLKPDNILVCHEYSATDDGALVFKISDFGQAREVQHVLQSDGNRRRQPPAGLALAGREGTYHAPEIQGQNTRLEIRADTASRKWDVWSFGCIFLLVIIFNYQGAEAIERFYQARRKQSPMGDDDCFCNPEARRSENVCNPAVTKHLNHYNYIESRAGNLELDDTITLESLKYLKKHILVRHGDRHDITNVSKKLHSIYNRRTPVGADITAHGYVPSDATHCGHSPDGTVFFYSPAKVVFYEDRRTFGAREILPLATESKWSGTVRPRSTSCARQSLCIVSESHGDFNCVFHNTNTNPRSMHLRDLRTPVDKVALSPDGSMLAIASRPGANHQARIRLYHLKDLGRSDSHGHRTSGSSSVTNSTVASDAPDRFEGMNIGRVDAVGFVVDLCFSGQGTVLYYACRLVNARAPRVRVMMWNTTTCSFIDKCTIKDTDTIYPFQFLTDITPYNTEVGFLCITHQRSIVKQTLHENKMHEEVFEVPDAKCLRAVLISSDDQKVVILATPDGSTVEIWGGLLLDPGAAKKLAISTKIRFDPKEDTAYIREASNEMRICLTSLREKKTYTFDLGRLFDL